MCTHMMRLPGKVENGKTENIVHGNQIRSRRSLLVQFLQKSKELLFNESLHCLCFPKSKLPKHSDRVPSCLFPRFPVGENQTWIEASELFQKYYKYIYLRTHDSGLPKFLLKDRSVMNF